MWDKTSPMWWHRSPVHRLFCIFAALLLLVAGYLADWLMVLLLLVAAQGGVS
jgi:hypothetical protein